MGSQLLVQNGACNFGGRESRGKVVISMMTNGDTVYTTTTTVMASSFALRLRWLKFTIRKDQLKVWLMEGD